MSTLIYVHGFLSSPESVKAQATRRWLRQNAADIDYLCPGLSPYPEETRAQLTDLLTDISDPHVGLIGSSLGGFWSTWLVERFGLRAVLINPSVRPDQFVESVKGEPQQSYHTEDLYHMDDQHALQFRQAFKPHLKYPDRYWLLVQTGDETLDYRDAVARYAGCRQTVEYGGDHGFQNYAARLPAIIEFLFPERAATEQDRTT